MKSKFKFLLLTLTVFAAVSSLSSCKKDDDHDHNTSDTDKPVITLTSPANLSVYNSGDTVKITGTVTDASLHELLIKITRDADSTVLFTETPIVHDLTSYTINTYWKSLVSTHSNVSLIVMAEDHNANVSSDTIHFHVMP